MTERYEGIGMQFLSLWSPSDPSLWHELFCLVVIAVTSHCVVVVVVYSCSIRNLDVIRFNSLTYKKFIGDHDLWSLG